MNPASILKDVLCIDTLYRDFGKKLFETDGDTFKLDTINPNQPWLYEYPTIIAGPHDLKVTKSCDFRKIIKTEYQFFANINHDHIFIAGGFVCNVVLGLPINDVDMFIHGVTEYDANLLVFDTINTIIHNIKKTNKIIKYEIINSKNSITINLKGNINIKIQIILRLYGSKSEILHGFDLGSSGIGYDGKYVYVTSLSKFAYEYGCNVIDPTRRSTTYEERLIKYLERGFKIIMPGFNMDSIDKSYIHYNINTLIDMPFLKILVNNISYNKLYYVSNLTKFDKLFDYYDINVRTKINIDNDLLTSFNSFMNVYHNTYVVHLDNQIDVVTKIIDYNRESQLNRSMMDRFINNHFVARSEHWVKLNPGTQLSGSFNPIIEDENAWYGKYYKKRSSCSSFVKIILFLIGAFLYVYIWNRLE
jgi:hypothetical protein